MAWTTPPTVAANTVISSATFGNVIRDDLLYLLTRPGASARRDNGANYTTTSAVFTPIDATNLSLTLTLSGSAALVTFCGVLIDDGTSAGAAFDVLIDPAGANTRLASAGADGLARSIKATTGVAGRHTVSFAALVTGLTPGAHTFRPVWKVATAGTAILHAGNGIADQDYLPVFGAVEVG